MNSKLRKSILNKIVSSIVIVTFLFPISAVAQYQVVSSVDSIGNLRSSPIYKEMMSMCTDLWMGRMDRLFYLKIGPTFINGLKQAVPGILVPEKMVNMNPETKRFIESDA